MRVVVTRGGHRLGDRRGAQAAARHAGAGHDRVRADARARPGQVALLRREHARPPPGPGAGRRRGAARHAARPRARGPDDHRSSARWTARRSSRRRSPSTSSTRSRAGTCSRRSTVDRAVDRRATSCRACARRSWPRRLREVHPVRAIDGVALPAAPGPLTQDAASRIRAHIEQRAGRLRLTLAASSPSSGTGRSSSRRRRSRACCAPSTTSCSSTPASTTTTSCRRSSSTELGIPRPERELGIHGGTNTEQTARMLAALGPLRRRGAPRRRPRLRRHELDARRRRSPRRRRGSRSPTSRRACAPSTARCPRSSTACSPTTSPTCCCARRRRRSPTSSASASPGAIELVGDVMVDVALLFRRARAADDAPLRDGGRRARASTCSPPPTARATSTTRRACARSSTCCSRCRWPVVLPLHPRTRARLEAAGLLGELEAAEHVRLLPPLGYVAFTALLARAPRGAHRLGRGAEGGLPRGRAVRDDARHDRVGRDGRRRAGTCSSTSTPTRRWRRWSARRRPSAPSSTATGTPGARVVAALDRALSRSAAADAPQRDAGRGEARAVEHAAPVDDRARAGQVAGPERAVAGVVGLQDGAASTGAPVPRRRSRARAARRRRRAGRRRAARRRARRARRAARTRR